MTGPRDDTLAGRVLDGRYRLEARIGGGGMGEVYRGRHLMMDQRVAIKVLHPDMAADPVATKRFVREAKATFRINHPSCIRVTDFGATDDGLLYLVMEYLDGRSIQDELRVDGPMDPRRVVHITRQVCEALDCAHGIGLIHRDLKPGNIMLVHRGQDLDTVKVLDFGLAKVLTGPDGALTAAFSMSPLTRQGMVFGTPEYMSPEQATEEPLTALTDIYSLGVVMYEMLTGEVPFDSESFMAVLTMHVREPPQPPSLRRPDLVIPGPLEAVVLQCLAKEPQDRPAGARALSAMLAEIARLQNELSAPQARVSTQVASSSTVDLDAQAVSTAAAAAMVQASGMSAHSIRELGMAETMMLNQSAHHQANAPAADGSVARRHAAAGTVHGAPALVTSPARPGPRRSRTFWALGSGALILGTVAIAVVGAMLPSSPDTSQIREQVTEIEAIPSVQAGPAALLPDASATAMVADPSDSADEAPADAAPADAAPEHESRPSSSATARGTARRVKAHIAAAERARRAGNQLRQMAEADSALRLAPDSRDAAYLFGDALVHSDKARGCNYLRQARRLRKARQAYGAAGCGRTD
jgi:eukaryotic-like serine/threonine-protein kinase